MGYLFSKSVILASSAIIFSCSSLIAFIIVAIIGASTDRLAGIFEGLQEKARK